MTNYFLFRPISGSQLLAFVSVCPYVYINVIVDVSKYGILKLIKTAIYSWQGQCQEVNNCLLCLYLER